MKLSCKAGVLAVEMRLDFVPLPTLDRERNMALRSRPIVVSWQYPTHRLDQKFSSAQRLWPIFRQTSAPSVPK
jgi:hypothetical protein